MLQVGYVHKYIMLADDKIEIHLKDVIRQGLLKLN